MTPVIVNELRIWWLNTVSYLHTFLLFGYNQIVAVLVKYLIVKGNSINPFPISDYFNAYAVDNLCKKKLFLIIILLFMQIFYSFS